MMFSDKFIYLQNEAYLVRGGLSVGLTAIRNAAVSDRAAFYTGFMNTAVSLERLMKIIVVTDYMIRNSYSVPTRSTLKTYGHDLLTLHASCVTIAARYGGSSAMVLESGKIQMDLLAFFSDFSTHARYYNLDALSGGGVTYEDPLVRWERLLLRVLYADAPPNKTRTIRAQASAIGSAIEDVSMVIQQGLDGAPLTLAQSLALPAMHLLGAQYILVRIFDFLSPLLELVGELGHAGYYDTSAADGPHVPVYSEFFELFGGSATEIRRKKRWP